MSHYWGSMHGKKNDCKNPAKQRQQQHFSRIERKSKPQAQSLQAWSRSLASPKHKQKRGWKQVSRTKNQNLSLEEYPDLGTSLQAASKRETKKIERENIRRKIREESRFPRHKSYNVIENQNRIWGKDVQSYSIDRSSSMKSNRSRIYPDIQRMLSLNLESTNLHRCNGVLDILWFIFESDLVVLTILQMTHLPPSEDYVKCHTCSRWCLRDNFSVRQWKRGPKKKCKTCVEMKVVKAGKKDDQLERIRDLLNNLQRLISIQAVSSARV